MTAVGTQAAHHALLGRRSVPAVRVLAALAVLTVAAGVLSAAGPSAPFPPLSASGVLAWADRHHPAVLAVAMVRAAGLLAVVHLAVAVIVVATAGVPTGRARRLLPGRSLRVAAALLGTTLVPLPALAAPTTGATPAPPPPPAVLRVADEPAAAVVAIVGTSGPTTAPTTTASTAPTAPAPATLAWVGSHGVTDPLGSSAATAAPDPASPIVTTTPAVPAVAVPHPAETATVMVRSGEHCWGIAAREVAARLGGGAAPGDEEVWPYFQALLQANADRFAVPGEPDLVFPGQILVLPPWPA